VHSQPLAVDLLENSRGSAGYGSPRPSRRPNIRDKVPSNDGHVVSEDVDALLSNMDGEAPGGKAKDSGISLSNVGPSFYPKGLTTIEACCLVHL
jgi:hypothetical protein